MLVPFPYLEENSWVSRERHKEIKSRTWNPTREIQVCNNECLHKADVLHDMVTQLPDLPIHHAI